MGRTRRPQPVELKRKLSIIRKSFGWTMDEMAEHLISAGSEESIHSGYVADYESGKREPSLLVILTYAQLAGISTDILINDKLDLPNKLTKRLSK